ncbi:unnamed protein product, partial [Rotaria sp. Silwood2]
VFGACGSAARLIVRGKNGAVVTKIWGHENIVAGASLGELYFGNRRSVLCEFTTSGTAVAGENEIETLVYELRYTQPNDPTGEPTVIKNTLSLKFVDDESLVMEIDPRVKIMCATQTAADMDKKIAELVKDGKRKEAMDLVTEKIALLKDVEQFDDERGIISLILRLAENMHNKLKDETVDKKLVSRGYEHQAYLLEEDDDQGFGLFD